MSSKESDTFGRLFERSADPILLLDPQTATFVDANAAAVSLIGCDSKESLLYLRPSDWSPERQPDGRPSVEAAADFIEETERCGGHRFEWVGRRADGVEIPLEVVATALQIGGRSLHVVVARDVKERKLAEAALRENQAVLTSITENISEAIYRSDAAHRLIFVNRAYLEMFRYGSLAELQAVPRETLYAMRSVRQGLLELLARDGAFSQQEVEYVRKDGTRFWGLASSRVIRDPQTGAVAYHVGAIADITDSRRAANEIQRLNATLERRIAERTAELTASEAQLRTLVEHAPEAIVVYDGDDGQFVSCNENAVRLFGVPRERLCTMTPLDVSPAVQPDGRDSAAAVQEWLQRALAGEASVFEWMHRHASGRPVPCEVRLVRLPVEGRRLVRGSVLDNTERHRRERIQQATYQISEAVHTAGDLETLYLQIHESIRGLMPARNFYIALLNPVTQLIEFPYFQDEFDTVQEPRALDTGLTSYVLRSGQPLLVDSKMNARKRRVGNAVTFDGFEHITYVESGRPSVIWLGVPLKGQAGTFGVMAIQDYHDPKAYGEEEMQILGFVAAQTAIAIERKRSDQALRESEEKFRALFEASSQGVMLHDTERYLEVNPATLRILGYSKLEELIGRHPKDTSPAFQPDGRDSASAARQYIEECMARGHVRFDWIARSAQGVDIPLEVILTRIEMGGRNIIQAVINDISDRKRAEADLRRALERERELSALKSNFVSMVSHEFRTPLGIIMSSAGILQKYFERLEPAERREHLDSITRNTRRMGDLMEEVLLLARLDADRLSFQPAALDLGALCRLIADEVVSVTSGRCPLHVRVSLPDDPAQVDENLLRHILTNLLTNAVKYSDPGCPVEFTVERSGGEVVCTVSDHGIGIPEEDREWLFHAFHRGQNVGRRSGTGLGLVIVQRCLELHGGTLQLQSAVGAGTTMTVRLPVYTSAPGRD
jgi:PAS domain S-box-containing protein